MILKAPNKTCGLYLHVLLLQKGNGSDVSNCLLPSLPRLSGWLSRLNQVWGAQLNPSIRRAGVSYAWADSDSERSRHIWWAKRGEMWGKTIRYILEVHLRCRRSLHSPVMPASLRWKDVRTLGSRFLLQSRLHVWWKPRWSQNLVPWFYFSFPISKTRAVFNSNFPAEGKGNFHVWKNGTPSHLRTLLPRNTCLLQLKPVQTESPGSGASLQMLHYSTIFITHLSTGYDSLGRLQPRKPVPWPWHGTANSS